MGGERAWSMSALSVFEGLEALHVRKRAEYRGH